MTLTHPAALHTRPSEREPANGLVLPASQPVLDVHDLSVTYDTPNGGVAAVRNVSLSIRAGETLGVVGESGCGKSTLSYAIMGHLGDNGRLTSGSIQLQGRELTTLDPVQLRRLRGRTMAMVYQDPQTSLNPAIVVGEQVAEAYRIHTGKGARESRLRALEMLERVGLPDPAQLAQRYAHQLSGGQQQRVVIAMALVNNPSLLLMDEPTTGLDVTTEALILDLVNQLKREFDAAILYISHNLGVIAQVCDRVAVMYAGEVVEEADVHTLFREPHHPYTVGLLGCVPQPGLSKTTAPLQPIVGHLPSPDELPGGCVFAPRCDLARAACRAAPPNLEPLSLAGSSSAASDSDDSHRVRCYRTDEVPAWAHDRAARARELLSLIPPVSTAAAAGDREGQASSPQLDGAGSPSGNATDAPLLEVRQLSRFYGRRRRPRGPLAPFERVIAPLLPSRPEVRAVEDVSFDLAPGETLALVGESGCGKTTLARTVAGLMRPSGGRISFLGHDIACTVDARPASLRRDLQMVFQNPDASLNPRHSVGNIIRRPVELFLGLRGRQARQRVCELLESVQLDASYYDRSPRQLSGGEKQRVSIARAFAGNPRLVICDEAVSALDVSVQAAILNLLVTLQQERGTSYLFISHDLGVVRYLADWVGVMYLGKLVDFGRTEDVVNGPHHPYTEALISAMPLPDPTHRQQPIRLQGPVPSPTERPQGCPFAGRCPRYLGPVCDSVPPPVQDAGNGHTIACHIPLAELAQLQTAQRPPAD